MKTIVAGLLAIALLAALSACGRRSEPASEPAPAVSRSDDAAGGPTVTPVDGARLRSADTERGNWLSHGRTYDEQRFSPLTKITAENVGNLGLSWYFDVPTKRGMEATPIVVDGRMYVTGSWSIVYALDASDGSELWRYNPEVPKDWVRYACCDAVNRGVAVWGDSVFVGTLDGWLVALDAATGTVRWRVDTIDRTPPYTITGAPRIIDGLVIIGNGGAEFGVRGYVSAYDADSGELRWRFHTVPGNPQDGFENPALAAAAATWTGEWWRMGGGGTVWDSMAYDPELDLLYVGTGNGSPWNRKVRSPGGGDNLYLSSIIALRPATGEYVWHYQTTPGDTWDFTAAQHIILADLELDGEPRKVLMQAPKNGFFYVIDRTSGDLISAEPFVQVNWASGIDMQTGRPIEAPNARYTDGPFMIMPSPFGAHNWHPMAFNPNNGLVYLPTQDIPFVHGDNEGFEFIATQWNTATDFELVAGPEDPAAAEQLAQMIRGQLIAWDPVAQKEVWRYQHLGPWNGGVLATAGDLVFQGSLLGEFAAYDAGSGDKLWQFQAQSGIVAAPISYLDGDRQQIAVTVGWGTVFALAGGEGTAALGNRNVSRVLAFELGGTESLPALPATPAAPLPKPPALSADADTVAHGRSVYFDRCWSCHGNDAASGGITPDLRYSTAETHASWSAIVLGGSARANGMPGFGDILNGDDSAAVQAYVIERAQRAFDRQQALQD